MATLDELLDIEGVVAAGEFGADGSLRDYKAKMDMSPEMAQMTAQFCATVTMMFNTLASSYTQLSGMRWVPQQGWAYSGGDWTVAMGSGGHKGVFVETARADFNRLFEALVETDVSPSTEPIGARPTMAPSGSFPGTEPISEDVSPSRTEDVPIAEEVPSGTPPQAPPGDVQRETSAEPKPTRMREAPPTGQERPGEMERGQEEDKGLIDRAREALLGEEEPRRKEGTDRPERMI
jgi:roadblock/LC7 domain-containing protein